MTTGPLNLPEVVAEVRSAFEAYEAALKRNDVHALNEFFWDSAETVRFGIADAQVGIAHIRHWRLSAPPISPTRRLQDTKIATFGHDTASVSTLFLTDETLGVGRQMQTWVKFDIGWKIVAAHVSVVAGQCMYGRPSTS